jgi:ubiquinone/menaquinone biosynthesis C-methylase UbiE
MPQPFADAKTIFNALALEYDAYRPGYPKESIDFLLTLGNIDRMSTVGDIGAGTGRLALALAPHVRMIYAVDTANLMLDQLQENAQRQRVSNIRSFEAPGERTGISSQALDLVVLSQVYHWMDKLLALREMHRILKPGRPMAIVWNEVRNHEDEYHRCIQELIKRFNPNYKGGLDIVSQDFPESIDASALFDAPETFSFPFSQHYAPEAYIGYLLSKSYIGVGIARSKLPSFMQEAHEIIHSFFGNGKVCEEYQTMILTAVALED